MSDEMPRIVLASSNAGKAREFGRLLAGVALVEPLPADINMPEEALLTFVGNARLKASVAFAALGGRRAVLADDSGLEVAALDGKPGVKSARYAGPEATDEENVQKLLAALEGRPDRDARFVCCLCLLFPIGGAIEVEGTTEGTITEAPRGGDGFGYDPVFQPKGWPVTLAEADPEQKDAVSHRGAAVHALLDEFVRRGLIDLGV
jgi:XTP/dITP diphosphohydrolase